MKITLFEKSKKEEPMRTTLNVILFTTGLMILAGCAGSGGNWPTVNVPSDPDHLYATGVGESADLQLAIDKAALNARTEIGRQLELKLNSLQKGFAEEVGGAGEELRQMYTSATTVVVSTQLMGSKIKEQKYQQNKGKYQAIVLVEYPIGAAHTALVNQIKKDENLYTRFRASESFKELDAEVEKLEQEKK